jgi:hypothetical protein
VGHFLRGRPNSVPTPAHLLTRTGLPTHHHAAVADRWGPPASSLFPQIFPPLLAHVATPTKLPATGRPPVSTPRHKDGRVFICTLSHRIDCGVPWRPITVARCSAAARRCSREDARYKSSTMKPRTTHPADGAGAAKEVPSRPWRSPAGARAQPRSLGVLAPLVAPRGHLDAPPV